MAREALEVPVPNDILYLERWIHEWGLLFQYSIAAYWAGHPVRALSACDRLLEVQGLPDAYRRQVVSNRRHCLPGAPGGVRFVVNYEQSRTAMR
jgi:hypothetical protein